MIRIVERFTGYPRGVKRVFAVGETPDDVDQDYADLLVAKKHAARMSNPSPKRKGKSDEAE